MPICRSRVYDPAKAKQILDAAGWKPGAGGIREKDGVKLAFTNSTTAGNHVREQAQELLQQTWREIGADMQIKNMPAAVIWGDYYNLSKYDSVMVGQDEMTGPDPDVTHLLRSKAIPAKGGAGQNTMQYVNPKVDELLAAGRAQRWIRPSGCRSTSELQSIIRADLPMLPIFQYARIEGTKAGLIGYEPSVYVAVQLLEHLKSGIGRPDQLRWRGYLLRRLGQSLILLLLVSVIGFALLHLAPGGPLAQFTLTPGMTQADLARIAHQMGLDRPLPIQYWEWFRLMLTGDWGRSYRDTQPVLGSSARICRQRWS